MLNKKSYFIRERVGLMKLSDRYDILDPQTLLPLGIAKEKPSKIICMLRLLINKQLLPTQVLVYEGDNDEDDNKLLFSIQRNFTVFHAAINIYDHHGTLIGMLKNKTFSMHGAFSILDANNHQIAFVKGDWKCWNFSFLDHAENEIAIISKKMAGVGKELFTSSDNYILTFNHQPTALESTLLLAAGLAVDILYKEK